MENCINNLLVKDVNNLTEKQLKFLNVHSNIVSSEISISNSIVDLAENLKVMKDDELYKEAGFLNFEDYAEQACGIKRSQAYKYLKVLDSLGKDFVHSNGQIGITKLNLLSCISEEEREVIQAEVNISDVSVSELKDKIKSLTEDVEKANSKASCSENLLSNANVEIKQLKSKINELKSNVEVKEKIVDNPKLQEKINLLETLLNMKENTVQRLQKQKDELKSQVSISNSSELMEFKVLFENIQFEITRMKRLIDLIPEEKREGCKNAMKKVGQNLC